MLKEEGSSATDSLTDSLSSDVTDLTDVSPMSVGRRKKEEVRCPSEKRTTFKLLETGFLKETRFLGVILFWWKLLKRKS